jgi:hypothetical protein
MTRPMAHKEAFGISAGGLSADSSGNLYLITGNGTFDANTGGVDYGDSFLRMTRTLSATDYFTPDNQLKFDDDDLDLGSSAGLILPKQSGSYPDESNRPVETH